MSTIAQWWGLLCRVLGLLLKTCLSLMKNAFKVLAKGVLMLLGITVVALAIGSCFKQTNKQTKTKQKQM